MMRSFQVEICKKVNIQVCYQIFVIIVTDYGLRGTGCRLHSNLNDHLLYLYFTSLFAEPESD